MPSTLTPTIPRPHLAVLRWQHELSDALTTWYVLSAVLLVWPSAEVLGLATGCLDVARLVMGAVDRAENSSF